jgi:DNA-directed RNA polymerase subunit RPC12/RpoP
MAAQTKGKQCPRCGSRDIVAQEAPEESTLVYVCMDCDHTFEVGGRVKEKFDKKRRRQGPEGSSPEFEGGMR